MCVCFCAFLLFGRHSYTRVCSLNTVGCSFSLPLFLFFTLSRHIAHRSCRRASGTWGSTPAASVAVVVALDAVVAYGVGMASLTVGVGIVGAGMEEASMQLAVVVEADTAADTAAAVVDGEQQQLQWRLQRQVTLDMLMKQKSSVTRKRLDDSRGNSSLEMSLEQLMMLQETVAAESWRIPSG